MFGLYVYLYAVQWLKSTRRHSNCLMLILHEGLFNANVYKTNALKWLYHWPRLCVFQHASRSIERSTVSLHYNYNHEYDNGFHSHKTVLIPLLYS